MIKLGFLTNYNKVLVFILPTPCMAAYGARSSTTNPACETLSRRGVKSLGLAVARKLKEYEEACFLSVTVWSSHVLVLVSPATDELSRVSLHH